MPDYLLHRYVFPVPADRSGASQPPPEGGLDAQSGFAPPVDVCETDSGYELVVEIAGVDPATVDIVATDDGRTVTIAGTRAAVSAARRGRFLNLEIQYGRFARRVILPESIDRDAASASYRDGFLVITLPKRPSPAKRRIPVTGA